MRSWRLASVAIGGVATGCERPWWQVAHVTSIRPSNEVSLMFFIIFIMSRAVVFSFLVSLERSSS